MSLGPQALEPYRPGTALNWGRDDATRLGLNIRNSEDSAEALSFSLSTVDVFAPFACKFFAYHFETWSALNESAVRWLPRERKLVHHPLPPPRAHHHQHQPQKLQ